MKKLIALLLTLAMVFSLAACSSGDNAPDDEDNGTEVTLPDETGTQEPDSAPDESTPEDDTADDGEDEPPDSDEPSEPEGDEGSTPADSGLTMGESLRAKFTELMESGETYSMESLAQTLVESDAIEFSGASMEVTEGYLAGFSEEISGFSEGYMFGPVIGSIPFVGYVFYIEDSAEVDSFVETLEANADLRWNICTEAAEMVTASYGNTVFFVMCP